MRFLLSIVLAVFLALATVPTAIVAEELAAAESPPKHLPRIAPLSPDEAFEAFEIIPGFRIELVAAEPLVVDPVAIAFDARGRLVVVEMRGYSERSEAMEGRVRRLTDTDGDGRMDKVETLAEGLSWPTAVAVCEEGIVVAAAPEILLIPEPEQTGTAGGQESEVPKVLFRGLGKSNVQGLVNSLVWGLDLRLHGATSSSGGEIQRVAENLHQTTAEAGPEGATSRLPLGRRDFAIQWPQTLIEAVDGGGQHGMMIDPWGDKYVCSNSDHLQQVWMLKERAWRAKQTSSPQSRRRSIAIDGPQADVFRLSPVEPWRILRTHLRVTGQATGPIEGGGRAAGYFTGATGVYVYDGDQWKPTDLPTALVCDVGSNLVHRKRLVPDGLWNRGERIDPGTEFLRSKDIWFRPVQLGTGPDGALYIVDMYREVIEHPASLPPPIKSQLDLNSGNDRGRIWRVVADSRPVRRENDLSSFDPVELAAAVDHPNAWQRRTAARMIVQKHRLEAIPALMSVVRQGAFPEGRLQALATLAVLAKNESHPSAFNSELLAAAIADPHARVRQRAIEYGAEFPEAIAGIPLPARKALATDSSVFVRFQLAWDVQHWLPEPEERIEALVTIASRDIDNRMLLEAVEGALGGEAPRFLKRLVEQRSERSVHHDQWIAAAIFQTLKEGDDVAIGALTQWLEEQQLEQQKVDTAKGSSGWEATLMSQLRLVKFEPRHRPLATWFDTQLHRLVESNRDVSDMHWALLMTGLRWGDPQGALERLREELQPTRTLRTQGLALQYLVGADEGSAKAVLSRWGELTPGLQQLALQHLSGSRSGVQQILDEIRNGRIDQSSLSREMIDKLTGWIREDSSLGIFPEMSTAAELSATTLSIDQYRVYEAALDRQGDIDAGRKEFMRVCSSCHRVGEIGAVIGPELGSIVDKSPSQILQSILYPNREVDPRYRVVQIQTDDGRLIAGIVEDERDSELQILDGQGNRTRVARESIEVLRTLERSLMPEELANDLSPQQVRDLIAFLKAGK